MGNVFYVAGKQVAAFIKSQPNATFRVDYGTDCLGNAYPSVTYNLFALRASATNPKSHNNNAKPIGRHNKWLCTDDFGNSVFLCQWTNTPVSIADAVVTGGYMPGVHIKFIAAPNYRPAMKASKQAFDAAEANCNTCKHFVRTGKSDSAGFFRGRCRADPFRKRIPDLIHPDDPMDMPCWEAR